MHWTLKATFPWWSANFSLYIQTNSWSLLLLTSSSTQITSFNLTNLLYLYQVYSGATPLTTYKVVDNIINDELFISDSSTLRFDGFYSLDEDKIGPFYTANDTEIATQTLMESLVLAPDKNNYINFESINTNFGVADTNIALSNGYYLIKGNSYFKFDIDLYFESDLVLTQTVKIKLVNQFGEWLLAHAGPRKFRNTVEYLQSPRSNLAGLAAAFEAWALLHDIKMDVLQQLDLQHPGQEGWVMATPAGIAKAVNRLAGGFTAANRELNQPKQAA